MAVTEEHSEVFHDLSERRGGKFRRSVSFVCGDTYHDFFVTLKKSIWIAAVAVCCYFMIHQMEACLTKLSDPPISTQTNMNIEDKLSYPAVTFCFKNTDDQGYDLDWLKHLGVKDYWIDSLDGSYCDWVWEDFNFSQSNLETIWKEATYEMSGLDNLMLPRASSSSSRQNSSSLRDMKHQGYQPTKRRIVINAATLNSRPIHARGVLSESRFFHEHGRCTTFWPPSMADKPFPGERHGYKFNFMLQPSPSKHNQTSVGAFDIFIHDPKQWWSENPLMSFRGEQLHFLLGKEIWLKLSELNFTSLSKMSAPCSSEVQTMSYSECTEKCRWQHIVENPEINCTLPFMRVPGYEICSEKTRALMAKDRYRLWTDLESKRTCEGKCTKSCNVKMYSAQVTREKILGDEEVSHFHIYFPSGVIQSLKEQWGYDTTLFIADFGGSLGFLLGVSLLGVLEIVEGLVMAAYRIYMDVDENTKRKVKVSEEPSRFAINSTDTNENIKH